jgi:hypothetical protein
LLEKDGIIINGEKRKNRVIGTIGDKMAEKSFVFLNKIITLLILDFGPKLKYFGIKSFSKVQRNNIAVILAVLA